MATYEQARKVSELLQLGWRRATEPANLDPSLLPIGLPTALDGPDNKKYVVCADGSVRKDEVLDWDQYCTGGKADWSHRPPMY